MENTSPPEPVEPEETAPPPAGTPLSFPHHHVEQLHLCRVSSIVDESGEIKPSFEASEHTFLGDMMSLYFSAEDPGKAGKVELTIPHPSLPDKKLKLTYGQIVALAGDFYGDPAQPISTAKDPRAAFAKAFATLAEASATKSRYWPQELNETQGILRIMQEEIDAVKKAIANGKPVEEVFEKLNLHGKWNYETGGWENLLKPGRYLDLAAVNWDHFGRHALVCYKAGHGLALDKALEAKSSPTPKQTLELAYAINAFADHYLSDLFSAGHFRTPRWELPHDKDQGLAKPWVLSLLSKYMHDEDSRQGLYVKNARHDSWKAYGDKRYFAGVAARAKAITAQAMRLSVAEVTFAFLHGKVPSQQDYAPLQLIPDLAQVADYEALLTTKLNHSPLFIHKKDTEHKTLRRYKLDDPGDYAWDWYEANTTLVKLQALKPEPAPLPPSAPAPATAPVIDPNGWQSQMPRPPRWVKGNKVRYAVRHYNELSDSSLGPWCPWTTLNDRFFPTLTQVPILDRRAPGRIIVRQFHFENEAQPRPEEIAGRLGFHEMLETTFVDRKG